MPLSFASRFAASQRWADPLAKWLQPLIKRAVSAPPVHNLLDGVWLGAPLHPPLTDVPIGAWTTALLLDTGSVLSGDEALGAAADRALADAFARLTGGASGAPDTLTVQGRRLLIPKTARGVAWFDFASLCERPLGAADYLAIATHYHCLILAGVPRLSPERRDTARRFITLIDALYEHRTQLICSAAAAPDRLYPAGDAALEFKRTASRLIEMQAADYLARPHLA